MGSIYRKLMQTVHVTRLPVAPLLLLFVLIGLSVAEGYALYKISRDNRTIGTELVLHANEHSRREILFAKARLLDKQGKYQEALHAYSGIVYDEDTTFKERVLYNMGTIYLREAAKHWNTMGVRAYSEVNTLVDLAQEAFREVLRLNSQNWDARYNLEYALRIKPPVKKVEKADWHGRKSSVFAILPGTPGGRP